MKQAAHNPMESGFTVLELMVVVAILSITMGAAVARLYAGNQNADSAVSALIANLRVSRAQAVGSGYHYRVRVTGTSTYDVQRMLPPSSGTAWGVDPATPTRTVALPATTRFAVGSGSYEFDTRGNTVGATGVANLTLHDSVQNRDLVVQVWPSGQVNKG